MLLAAGAGTYAVLKAADAKATQAAAPAPARFDRSTPLGALRDLADALKVGDGNRVVAAIHTESDAAKVAIAAMGDMRSFNTPRPTAARSGSRTVPASAAPKASP